MLFQNKKKRNFESFFLRKKVLKQPFKCARAMKRTVQLILKSGQLIANQILSWF